MPFDVVPTSSSGAGAGGNFPLDMLEFFNTCGENHYQGSITFKDARHMTRKVPIFHQDCLEGKSETKTLVTTTRQAMRGSLGRDVTIALSGSRSIHQNSAGYLPYQKPAPVRRGPAYTASPVTEVNSESLHRLARSHGQLPNNQSSKGDQTRGEFIEITCGDGMHDAGRLVVDYRFGIVYMTFGHYHPESFAVLIRSTVELDHEIKPVLRTLSAQFEA